MSKKLHPDLNTDLSDLDKKLNNESFIRVTKSYEVLSDSDKRKEFDREHGTSRREFHRQYYGKQRQYSHSGLNITRNRVHYTSAPNTRSIFNGEFRDHSINDVPHFDYAKHLLKNINVDKRYVERHGHKSNDFLENTIRRSNINYDTQTMRMDAASSKQDSNKMPLLISVLTLMIVFKVLAPDSKKNG